MPEIAPVTIPSTPATRTGFTVDTSSLANIKFDASVLQKKVDAVTTRWAEDNLDLSAEAKMWQIRNENVAKTLESTEKDVNLTGDVTVQVPTTKDGKELSGWKNMPVEQQEAMWKEAISGNKYEKNSQGQWVMARDSGGQLIKSDLQMSSVTYNQYGGRKANDFLATYEGLKDKATSPTGDASDEANARSRNQTIINNIMSANSNKLSQATTKSNFGISQLQTALNTIQQLFTEFFNALKQISNSISA
jgi:hypothetical protein